MENNKERMLELLADQSLFGLTESETAELKKLKKIFPEFKDDDSFEMTAATINLVNLQIEDSLPTHLQAKLEASYEIFEATQKTREFSSSEKSRAVVSAENNSVAAIYGIKPKRAVWQWFGLAFAAACVVLAIGLWVTRSKPQPEIAQNQKTFPTPESAQTAETAKSPEVEKSPGGATIAEPTKNPELIKSPESAKVPKTATTPETARIPEPVKTPTPELTVVQKREQLVASAPDLVQAKWTSAKGDKKVSGDVVWSNSQQKGYIRMRDLPVLDASKETYQLWIVDEARNEKTPVSGGIFNVAGAGEIIIPINARLKISQPKQFAVTKEKAGGVVVSKSDRVVAIAKI